MRPIGGLLKNLFTVNNGEDLSFAKIMGAIGFLALIFMVAVGVPLVTVFAQHYKIEGMPSLEAWSTYYTGAAVLVGAAYGGLAGLIWGTNKSENPPAE